MFKNLMIYIQKLQNLEEDVKRLWLIFLTILTTVVVILFWMIYLNATVLAVDEVPKPTTWQIFKKGISVVGEKVEYGLANSYIYFTQGKQINIK